MGLIGPNSVTEVYRLGEVAISSTARVSVLPVVMGLQGELVLPADLQRQPATVQKPNSMYLQFYLPCKCVIQDNDQLSTDKRLSKLHGIAMCYHVWERIQAFRVTLQRNVSR